MASTCAGVTALTVLGTAPSASAAAPKEACAGLYNAPITFWAMTCSQPSEPMIGGFATRRNIPIAYDQVDTGSATVQVANYLRVSPNTSSSPLAPNIEIGLYAEKTGKTTHTYGPRWSELTTSGGRTTAIKVGVNPTKPDKRDHTYMTVRQDSGNQWDVLYDFNKVGATTKQLKVVGGNTNRIDVGLEVMGPKYINVPSIANRMQFMTGNKVWQQVAMGNVAKSVTLPVCSASHKSPNCFTTKLTDNSKFTQWTVSKPRRQAAAAASPAAALAAPTQGRDAAAAGLPATFNGVDQQALQACLETDPDSCLATVPGLSECVVTVRVCNAAALPFGGASGDAAAGADVSAADIRARAAAAFDVPADALAVEPPASPAALKAHPNTADSSNADAAWTVTSRSSTPGLQRTDRRFDGFTARYSGHTGALLEACWGDLCDAS
ncbi:hypothetical protein SSP24_47430 [Streptomyces spinoverrucosus]|uniref:Uncharacterized protein n=2 Tax=Streptomyces spinoverrucosus TaxID=284043 RepID=A0A4Y3VLQ1_9ACTN|nr:hypothetical protein SSP24_47430 [Streptomyces spinoverrucosus]GHB92157.1 hypothetical protein GCM10010397_75650 [Streptomyces spinoverrucosus]